MKTPTLVLIAGLMAPAGAAAQSSGAPAGPHLTSAVEVGGDAGLLVLFPQAGARLGVRLTAGTSLELTGQPTVIWLSEDPDARYYLLQAQLRRKFTERHPLFLTFGASRTVTSGRESSEPHRRRYLHGPILPHVGIAGQHALSSRVAWRWDVQVLIAPRASAIPVPRASVGLTAFLGSRR